MIDAAGRAGRTGEPSLGWLRCQPAHYAGVTARRDFSFGVGAWVSLGFPTSHPRGEGQ